MRSEILVVNTTVGTALADGATYAPNQVIRRYGCNCKMAGNGVVISGAGYYDIDATVTVTASGAGTVTASILQDGIPIVGAASTATVAAAGVVTIPLATLARLNCNCNDSTITVAVTGQATTTNNLSLRVVKE